MINDFMINEKNEVEITSIEALKNFIKFFKEDTKYHLINFNYLKDLVKELINLETDLIYKIYLKDYDITLENDIVTIILCNNLSLSKLKDLPIKLNNKLFNNFNIKAEIILKVSEENKNLDFEIPESESNNVKNRVIFGKSFSKRVIEIKDLKDKENGTDVSIEGIVFNYRLLKSKTGKNVLCFNITDELEAVSLKAFVTERTINLKDGTYVKVRGKKIEDDYNDGEVAILVTDIVEESKIKKEKIDESSVKRIEIHAHSKMSELDSIIDSKELIDTAISYGHESLAITDGGVLYSFPYAYNYAKKKNFKLILGLEGYVVEDLETFSIDDKDFIVLDIETTGYNPYKDKIIEIACVKIVKNEIKDTYSTLINPGIQIPNEIINITGINNNMVKNSPRFEEIYDNLISFIGDSNVVAHNADFDIGFLIQHSLAIGKNFNYTVIDNLKIARNTLKDIKKFGLKDLAKYFDFSFNHHRALDDAMVTAKIFLNLIKKNNIKETLEDVNILNSYPNNTLILVKNNEGLKSLYEIVSLSHIEGFRRIPKISKKLLSIKRDGLLIGSCMDSGEIISNYLRGASKEKIKSLLKFYDFVELTPPDTMMHLIKNESLKGIHYAEDIYEIQDIIKNIINLCDECNVKVIATSNVKYLNKEDHKFRKILLYGKGDKNFDVDRNLYFRNTKEMLDSFAFLGEDKSYEIVVTNTNLINKEIENVKPILEGFYPPKIEGAEEEVIALTYNKAKATYGDNIPEVIESRIKMELDSIINNGFAVLYLIAHKLVKKSLEDGYTVGSRGSVGSSLVAWLMDITEVNSLYPHYICKNCNFVEFTEYEGSGVDLPQKDCNSCLKVMDREGHSIPFEVFMGFKGDKVPDIDLNFSGEYQSKVHKYVEDLFGKKNVFRAGTISSLAKKNAFGYVRKYVEELDIKMNRAQMEYLSLKCENVRKTTGQHPGGMIVIPHDRSIYDFTPIQKPANDISANYNTTHFDYHVMDTQLVKLDILGHDDPTTIKTLEDSSGLNSLSIPLTDPETISIFNSTKALDVSPEDIGSVVGSFGIPEFGTPFVRRMLAETLPKTFAELVRISGLSHGTDVWTNNAQDLVKKGIAKISEVISVRDDIMNYLIDKKIEKATAFKIMEFVRKGLPLSDQTKWEEYISIMKKHNVPKWYIDSCQKIIYMFPKGHAVAYVIMAVRIAYYKVHKPFDFYAAFLTRKIEFFDFDIFMEFYSRKDIKIIKKAIQDLYAKSSLDVKEKSELAVLEILLEMFYRKVELLPIDLYKSSSSKFMIEEGKIRIPLSVMKGLGESVAENIVNERSKTFLSFEDLRKRTKLSKTICEKIKNLNLFKLEELNQRKLF